LGVFIDLKNIAKQKKYFRAKSVPIQPNFAKVCQVWLDMARSSQSIGLP
jgi:hypothetical protein